MKGNGFLLLFILFAIPFLPREFIRWEVAAMVVGIPIATLALTSIGVRLVTGQWPK